MNSGLIWTVVGSIAGVLAVLVAMAFGIFQVRQGKRNVPPSGTVGQNVQAGRDAYTAAGDQTIVVDRRQDH